MPSLKTVFDDVFSLTDFYNSLSGDSISVYPIRKETRLMASRTCVTAEETNEFSENYFACHLTPGIRINYTSHGIYSASFAYYRLFNKEAKAALGSVDGAELLLRKKRRANREEFLKFEKFMSSAPLAELRNNQVLYNRIRLFGWGLLDLNASVVTADDRIFFGADTRKRLAASIQKLTECYEGDIGLVEHILSDIYSIDCKEFITSISNIIRETHNAAVEMESLELLDDFRNSLLIALKADLQNRIPALHFNNEFPVLICELLKSQSYIDIALTQDSRDGGVDVWASKNEETDSGETKQKQFLFSCKRFKTNITVYDVKGFINDLKRYKDAVAFMAASSSFSRKATMMLNENKIQSMDINDIISIIINHKIGLTRNYTIDDNYWQTLSLKKALYRNGPLYKYPTKTDLQRETRRGA